jgi:predicted nucleic acid-binding protein
VDFLRSREGLLGDQVADAMAQDQACMCSVSVAELLQGVKGAKEIKQLELLFDNVPVLAVEPADWFDAGRTLHLLRGRGLQIPLTDALISAVAKRHKLSVLTTDKHFAHLGAALVP